MKITDKHGQQWQLVPLDPTESIERAYCWQQEKSGFLNCYPVYKAMLSAAPEPELPEGLEPLRPKMYWEDAERGYECASDVEALLDAFGDYEDIKVGATYSLNEAHYFDATFEVVKVPDAISDDYEIKRIEGESLVLQSAALAELAKKDALIEQFHFAIESMRVAGGRVEFQAAFDRAKELLHD